MQATWRDGRCAEEPSRVGNPGMRHVMGRDGPDVRRDKGIVHLRLLCDVMGRSEVLWH